VIQEAVSTAARNHAARTGSQHRTSAIQAQAVNLLRRSMAANAILPEEGQNIATEVHLTGILTEQNAGERACIKHGSSYSVIPHTRS